MRSTIKTLLLGAAVAAASSAPTQGQSCEYWEPLGPGTGASVLALTNYNGQLIAGGSFTDANPATPDYIARWDGLAWQPLADGLNGEVRALIEWNGYLVAAGTFTASGRLYVPGIALWNGATWETLGDVSASQLGGICTLGVYNNELIAGGGFNIGPTPARNIARWDGDSWEPIGDGQMAPVAPETCVRALAVHDGLLYAAGSFESVCGVTASNIAVWNSVYWSSLGNGTDLPINALCAYKGGVVVGGEFTVAGSTPAGSIALWDPTKLEWATLGQHLRTGSVFALTVHKNELVAAGDFTPFEIFTAERIARWRHGTWTTLGTGIHGDTPCIHALAPLDDRLIAAGCFSEAGGAATNAIAAWTDLGETPVITKHPDSLNRCLGQTAIFSVQATAYEPINYQWRRDGSDLVDDGRITGCSTPSLSIAALNAGDAGMYECHITSPAGCSPKCGPALLSLAIGDFNCSGQASVQDVFDFLAAYFAADPRADINGSDGLTVQDVFDFLAGYFAEQ